MATGFVTGMPSSQPSGAAYGQQTMMTWNERVNLRLRGTGTLVGLGTAVTAAGSGTKVVVSAAVDRTL